MEEVCNNKSLYERLDEDNPELLLKYTQDQYRIFSEMKKYFYSPKDFDQHAFYVDNVTISRLIEEYYSFDPPIYRELVGKKLNDKLRDNMDDICDAKRIKRLSGYRQFDNLKRIYKRVAKLPQSLETVIQTVSTEFKLPKHLTMDYIRLIYLSYNRFEVKKKLSNLTYDDCIKLADIFIKKWIEKFQPIRNKKNSHKEEASRAWPCHHETMSRLNGIKTLMIANKEDNAKYLELVLNEMNNSDYEALRDFNRNKLQAIIKSLLSIGSSSFHSKEFKKIFNEIVDKVIEPCKKSGLKKAEVAELFNCLIVAFPTMVQQSNNFFESSRDKYIYIWTKYLEGIKKSITSVLYDKV